MSDGTEDRPSKFHRTKPLRQPVDQRGGPNHRENMGPRAEPPGKVRFFVVCPQCQGERTYYHEGERKTCLCKDGYVETGYTQKRLDDLVKQNDQMLMLMDDVMKVIDDDDTAQALEKIGAFLRKRKDEVVAARSRTTPL